MSCFFSYYGGKSKIVKLYPKPIFDTIIEPFCGAANYSLLYWNNKIVLYDRYDIIINLWKYLIQASEKDILSLPILKYNENLDGYKHLLKEETYLIGFNINQGSSSPKKTVKLFNGWNERKRKWISDNLYKIRHWNVFLKDYKDIDNKNSVTWYCDPPYQFGGKYYQHKNIDYNHLKNWCLQRYGQIIVCENNKSNWWDFIHLISITGQLHKTKEVYKEIINIR